MKGGIPQSSPAAVSRESSESARRQTLWQFSERKLLGAIRPGQQGQQRQGGAGHGWGLRTRGLGLRGGRSEGQQAGGPRPGLQGSRTTFQCPTQDQPQEGQVETEVTSALGLPISAQGKGGLDGVPPRPWGLRPGQQHLEKADKDVGSRCGGNNPGPAPQDHPGMSAQRQNLPFSSVHS